MNTATYVWMSRDTISKIRNILFNENIHQESQKTFEWLSNEDKIKSVLKHSLTGSQGDKVQRNYFSANKGHHCMPEITIAMNLGLMERGRTGNDFEYYFATKKGAQTVGLKYKKPLKRMMN